MAFLISEGHPFAARYPLAKLWAEVKMARRTANDRIATLVIGIQSVGVMLLSKKGSKALDKFLTSLE